MNAGRRVVISGIGCRVPHGNEPSQVFSQLLEGKSAIEIISLTSGGHSLEVAAGVARLNEVEALSRSQRAVTDRVSQLALCAAESAVLDAGLNFSALDPRRVGVSVGTCMGGITSTENAYESLFRNDADKVAPYTLVRTMYNAPAAHIAMKYAIAGPSLTYSTTCSSSNVAIGEAMRQIRHAYVDVAIAGGADALLVWGSVKAWLALQIIAPPRTDQPSATCRPFSRDRCGTVISEGSAFVILEDLERAKARGARIYAELVGYGVVNDSRHMTQPSVQGQAEAMSMALCDAQMEPGSIEYINAHGTGTSRNDVVETQAIRHVFGTHADSLAVSSTKSMHGHLVGAAGALELALCALALQQKAMPPTAHLDVPDPECDLDYVPRVGRRRAIRRAMSNSFAFGGVDASLIVACLE